MIESFKALPPANPLWPDEVYQDYLAPIIRAGATNDREVVVASYGMVPKNHIPHGVKHFSTMNARSETVGQLRSYSSAWKNAQLCLVPMQCFYEPNWETGKHERWRIGVQDQQDFAVAGLWREWKEQDGSTSHSFTQLTINADDHPLLSRFHRPGDEKRSLVILPATDYDAWLHCDDPELARSFLRQFPSEMMFAQAAPKLSTRSKRN